MPTIDSLAITPYPLLSFLLWLMLAMVVGFMARTPAHRLIHSVFRALHYLLRFASVYTSHAAMDLRGWTREIALNQARAAAARQVQWDYDRLAVRVERELAHTPDLRRRLSEQLGQMEEDFRSSTEATPEPPAWGDITQTLTQLSEDRNGQLARTLEDIRDSMAQYRADARDNQRRASYRRYLLLHRMRPRWRGVQRLLDSLDLRLGRLQGRIDGLGSRIREFDAMRTADKPAVSALVAACIWRCSLSALALVVAAAGIVVLGNLMLDPMQTMMGLDQLALGLPTYLVTGSILLFLVLTLGLVIMESARATDLFPVIGSLDAPVRRLLFWTSFGLLLLLAATGAVLHYYLSEFGLMPADPFFPVGGETLLLVLTSLAHSLIILFLPFGLLFAALPLAVFSRTARVALGAFLAFCLHALAFTLRLLAILAGMGGKITVQLYDVLVFLPLWAAAQWGVWLRRRRYQARHAPMAIPKAISEVKPKAMPEATAEPLSPH